MLGANDRRVAAREEDELGTRPSGHVVLVPGFFGFANLGDFRYFGHVERCLRESLAARGLDVRVVHAPVPPTASLRERAAAVADAIAVGAVEPGGIHIVGHSTGGLDARLLVTPGATLPTAASVEGIARRVRSVVTVATPHHGTPTASYFNSRMGQKLLQLVSAITIHAIRLGGVPLPAMVALAEALALPRRLTELQGGLIDSVYQGILQDFSADRRAQIVAFLGQVIGDQALMAQLGPEAMDLFDARTSDRRSVRYGCVVTRARPPRLRGVMSTGLSPSGQVGYALYRVLHGIAAAAPAAARATSEQVTTLTRAFGTEPSTTDNDAVVPTLSQVHGEVLGAVWADHLDVIGHFGDTQRDPPHHDWLMTHSAFDRHAFARTWDAVADFIVRHHARSKDAQ